MAGLYNSYDHDAPDRLVTLAKELDNFKSNEAFYLELKNRIEAENQELVIENSKVKTLNNSLSEELKSTKEQLSFRDNEYDSLKAKLMDTEEELASLISLEQESYKVKKCLQM